MPTRNCMYIPIFYSGIGMLMCDWNRKRRCREPAKKPCTCKRTPSRKQKRGAAKYICGESISLQPPLLFICFKESGHQRLHFKKSSKTGQPQKQKKSLENVVFSRLLWRRRWDSNPRALAGYLISSQGRYDHFDTPPCITIHFLTQIHLISSQPRYDHFDTAAQLI